MFVRYRTLFHNRLDKYMYDRAIVRNKFEWLKPNGNNSNILVYNPIKKEKTELILKNKNIATWYMCGPTVYDSAHIGHACTYMRFDIIRRILSQFFDINVVLVMGLTDIDDKIIKRANESGKSWQSITKYYEQEFLCEMDALNITRPNLICRVSDYVPQIVSFVQKIIDKNSAYIGNDGSIYFNTSKYPHYGKLDVPRIEEQHPNKKSSLDFTLWKASKENEPYWDSPWGKGRPGWHIECSAIASSIFGNNIDIHSGGIDLAFPHHENEEAQSCCYHNVDQWVNYWFHTGHLHLREDTKMSKSLQNTIRISELLKSCSANQFRMLCLLSHYRNNVIFSEQLLNSAGDILKKIEFFIANCNDYICGKYEGGDVKAAELLEILENTRNKVSTALSDDFNTPKAVQAISKLITETNKMLQQENANFGLRDPVSIAAVSNYVKSLISKLGIQSTSESLLEKSSNLSKVLDILADFRNEIRILALEKNDKDVESLKACDTVRSNLQNCGIDLRDRVKQSTWSVRVK